MRQVFCRFAAVLMFVVPSLTFSGGHFHVAPQGAIGGPGTRSRPWTLTYALSHPPAVRPGDTIWIHGGTYVGAFTSTLRGAPGSPVVIRQYPGERAILDNAEGIDGFGLYARGGHTWFWGLEIRNSGTAPYNNPGVSMDGPGEKLINLIIHDHPGSGITSYSAAPDAEIYGCLIYYNGGQSDVPGKAYGIYTQNDAGRVKTYRENVIPYSWSFGIHAYTEGSHIDNFLWEGNVVYNSGILWRGTQFERNFFIGSRNVVANDNVYRDNHSYYPPRPSAGARNTFGYFAGTSNLVVTGNWFVGGDFDVSGVNPVIKGNTFYRTAGFHDEANTYLRSPTGTNIFVRPNAYERGRAHIIIYNWNRAGTVNVDVAGAGLQPGDRYEVRDALNWPGLPVAIGEYHGGTIAIPMTGLFAATPYRTPKISPEHTAPEFGVFILLPAGR